MATSKKVKSTANAKLKGRTKTSIPLSPSLKYDHKKIEPKWQKTWSKANLNKTTENLEKPKHYVLDMFPYPSGDGLHVGHPKGYIATDIYSRFKRMKGFNVLHPMGWDAFGLPAENYAIKNKVHPKQAVEKNIKRYKEQLSLIGFNYDWTREIDTTDPAYYKWTQWIFLQLYKKGLAYESFEPINWCPSCQTGLANEDVEDGHCERCGTLVEKKPMRQWVLKITKYADRLLKDLEGLDWPKSIKESQKNWIGRSEGMLFTAPVKDTNLKLQTFSAHFEAFCADTFVVIAPDHPFLKTLVKGVKNETEILAFADNLVKKRLTQKFDAGKEMEGIFTGRYIVDPVGNGDLPIWVASFALADYGTGIVKCSAHDDRDFAFAKKYNIPLKEVLEPFFTLNTGEDAVRPNQPLVERQAVVCVVKHWSEDKYLCLSWKKNNWQGFVIGGIEKGETAAEAGLREIVEETGFKNPVFVKQLGGLVHSQFYHQVKGVNRLAHFTPALFQLKDGEQQEISAEEKALHDSLWVSPVEMANFLNREDMKCIWNRVEEKTAWTDMANSLLTEPTALAGKLGKEARGEVIKYLEKNKLAKKQTSYKLKDWVFSRQRYWGEPIPVVHCAKCAGSLLKVENKSYLMGASNIKDKELTDLGIEIVERKDDGDRLLIIPTDALVKYERLISAKLSAGFWNEYLGQKTVFIFKHQDGKIEKIQLSSKTALRIDKLAQEFTGEKHHPQDPWKWLIENKWYSDGQIKNNKVTFPNNSKAKTVAVPVPEKDLPVKLPEVKSYAPTGTGESPLADISKWVNTKCPVCKGPAKRETNTMPQWAGSSWYYLRFMDPKNTKALVDPKKEKYWAPVDMYVGGSEHATRHLIYARFWHKFLRDIKVVSTNEPFKRIGKNLGLILGADGRKMSKRWGNVINPDEVIKLYGADTLRVYEMFMGPFDQEIAWNTDSMIGSRRFLERVWRLGQKLDPVDSLTSLPKETETILHQTIKKVGEDIESFNFNTGVSALMILTNQLDSLTQIPLPAYKILLQLLAPFAPHLADEVWFNLGNKSSIHLETWPAYNKLKLQDEEVTIVIQVNSKVRGQMIVKKGLNQDEAIKKAKEVESVKKWLNHNEILKEIYIPDRLINLVVKS